MNERRPRCLGVPGWLLGHNYGSAIYDFQRCKRCGLLIEQVAAR